LVTETGFFVFRITLSLARKVCASSPYLGDVLRLIISHFCCYQSFDAKHQRDTRRCPKHSMCLWNPPAACGEISDDYHDDTEKFCATFCCPCYWSCCLFTYAFVYGAGLTAACFSAMIPEKPQGSKRYKQRQKNAPRPLPRRRRQLTLPLPIQTNYGLFVKAQKTLDQHQSPLFRLPTEVRIVIWNEVMGHRVFHIGLGRKRLQHTLCTVCDPTDYCTGPEVTCFPLSLDNKMYPSVSAPQRHGILSLTKTCRRM
jgi:hypothetical protein